MRITSKPFGELCLDFANTVSWHASDHPTDTLLSYQDLIEWGRKSEVLTPQEADQLLEESGKRVHERDRVFTRGIELREAIYRIIVAHLHGQASAADDLDCLNRELEIAYRYLRIFPVENGYHLAWAKDESHLDRILWHIVRSAAELLTSAELFSRLGQCADDRGCGYLFIDWSKNHSRRWCDIKDCGNRAKQRRHYERSHGHLRGSAVFIKAPRL